MTNKNTGRFALSLFLLISIFTVSLPSNVSAQATQTVSADLQQAVSKIESKVEARRKELGIPGMSLVIIKDDQIVFMKGFGYKNFEKKIPVTADTQFAIGSSTKAFTALSVLMSQDEGKLTLDDSPKKYLPYFKINDAETDKNITIRDLLSHASGLNRTDLAMITGKLTREELIRVAGEAKPTAKLREKFQYQNIMFTAAGEIVSKVQKQPWEKFVPEKIFKPLGMTNSTMSVAQMHKAKDFSFGYDYNFDTKETRNLPTRDILQVAPAGSINSSARDMAQWLRFVLNRGEIDGKRLVSEKSFDEWTKTQMKIAPNGKFNYGLGWFLQDWKGMTVVQHGGNIDGFNALVAMIPEKNLGFVMLTNVSASSLGSELMPIVWENVLNQPASENKTQNAVTNVVATNPDKLPVEKLVGKYLFKETGFLAEIVSRDGKLLMIVPAQPEYTLEAVEGNKYKMSPLPEGFSVTFRPSASNANEIELLSEQPNTSFTMSRATEEDLQNISKKLESYKPLVGAYQSNDNPDAKAEFALKGAALTVTLTGQPAFALLEKEPDTFAINGFPATYRVKVKRGADNKITAITFSQPDGEFEYKRLAASDDSKQISTTVDELMPKVINALGGEANWRKINSREMKFEIDFVHQGLKATGTSWAKAPNMTATETTITALGKPIAESFEYFDGTTGGEITSFSPADVLTGQQLENAKLENDFYGILDWKIDLKSAEITKMDKVDGEDAYVVVLHPEKATDVTYFISAKTFLPLKKTTVYVSSTSGVKIPISQFFSDYRAVDGVMIPYKTKSVNPSMGDIVTYVKEIKHNVAIEDAKFKANQKKMAAQK